MLEKMPLEKPEALEVIFEYPEIKETKIPRATFECRDGKPLIFDYEGLKFAVETHNEEIPSAEFFKMKIERNENGELKSVKFSNFATRDYFLKGLKKLTLDKMYEIYQNERDYYVMGHATKPGALDPIKTLDRHLEVSSRIRNLESPVSAQDSLPAKIAEGTIQALDFLNYQMDKYFPEQKSTNDPKTKDELLTYEFDESFDLTYIAEEVVDWFRSLEKADIPIEHHRTKIYLRDKPFVIRRYTIGKVKTQEDKEYYLEERAAEKVLFAEEKLGMHTPRDLVFFENVHLDIAKNAGYDAFKAEPRYTYTSKFFDLVYRGFAMKNVIFLNPSAKETSEGSSSAMSLIDKTMTRLPDHELGHFINEYQRHSTKPQSEGFSVCIEYGFMTNVILNGLVERSKYSNDVTSDKIKSIMSDKPPKNLVDVEMYYLSGAFLSYTYNYLGPEKFGSFYRLLTGAQFDSN